MTSKAELVRYERVARRNQAVAIALENLTKAMQHNVLQFKVISERGHIRVWRFGSRNRHVDWWPYHRRAKLRCNSLVTRHRATNVDHCLDLLDYGRIEHK